MAQNQAVLALAEKHPEQFNISAVLSRMLKQMKVPNINELMKDVPAPEQRTSADENAALLIGQPAYAYLQQDHIAHIQDHLQFALNPFLGQSPFADPNYLNNLIEHLKQHMTLWYLNRSNGYVQDSVGKPVDDYDDPALTATIDKVYTTIGAHVMLDTQQVFGQFQQAMAQIIQMAQQRKNAPAALPPDAQVVKDTNMAETQRKTAKDQADIKLAQERLQKDMQEHIDDNQTKIAIENAKLMHQPIQPMAPAQPPAAPAAPLMPPQGEPNGNV